MYGTMPFLLREERVEKLLLRLGDSLLGQMVSKHEVSSLSLVFQLFLDKVGVLLVLLEEGKGQHGVFSLLLIGSRRGEDKSLWL